MQALRPDQNLEELITDVANSGEKVYLDQEAAQEYFREQEIIGRAKAAGIPVNRRNTPEIEADLRKAEAEAATHSQGARNYAEAIEEDAGAVASALSEERAGLGGTARQEGSGAQEGVGRGEAGPDVPFRTRQEEELNELERQEFPDATDEAPAKQPDAAVSTNKEAAKIQKAIQERKGGDGVRPGIEVVTEKALINGAGKLKRAAAKALMSVAKLFKQRVVFYKADRDTVDGFVLDGTVYLNVDASVSPMALLGHELTHRLQQDMPEAWKAVARVLLRRMDQTKLVAMYRNYFGPPASMSDAEITARLNGGDQFIRLANSVEGMTLSDTELLAIFNKEGAAVTWLRENGLGKGKTDKQLASMIDGVATFEMILGEIVSDYGGNQFTNEQFWSDVFDRIAAMHPEGVAKKLILRLRMLVIKMVGQMKAVMGNAQFMQTWMVGEDSAAADVQAWQKDVDTALKNAYAQWMNAIRTQGYEAARERGAVFAQFSTGDLLSSYSQGDLLAQDTKVKQAEKLSAAEQERLRKKELADGMRGNFALTGSDRAADAPGQGSLFSTKRDNQIADKIAEEDGIRPYTSQPVEVPVETTEARFSVRRKGSMFDERTGLWLNGDGTANLYLHTTVDDARRIQQEKTLKDSDGTGRVYLTNESSSWRVITPGEEQEGKGGVVMIKIDPSLLHEAENTSDDPERKMFFVPVTEGEAFKAKMQLWAIYKSRHENVSADVTQKKVAAEIAKAAEDWKAASVKDRREMLRAAKKILLDQHNIGTLMTENGKLESTRDGEFGLKDREGRGVDSLGLGMAAAQRLSDNWKSCPRSAKCEGVCLGDTAGGNMQYGGVGKGFDENSAFRSGPRLQQYLKTEAFLMNPYAFAIKMQAEIDSLRNWDKKEGRAPKTNKDGLVTTFSPKGYSSAIRLNVTSDIPPSVWQGLIEANPEVTFYDYTKLETNDPVAENHHLTYSSEGASQIVNGEKVVNDKNNWDRLRARRLDKGFNVAMAFSHSNKLPDFVIDEVTGNEYEVWDGDNYDARYLDPKSKNGLGLIIGLTKKDATTRDKEAAKSSGGFFIDYDPAIHGDTVTIKNQAAFKGLKGIPVKTESPATSQGGAPKAVSTSADTEAGLDTDTTPDPKDVKRADARMSFKRVDTESAEFKRWFGDSKVVDADGKPLKVYHGSKSVFTAFDLDFAEREDSWSFSSDIDVARTYQPQNVSADKVWEIYQGLTGKDKTRFETEFDGLRNDDGEIDKESFELWADIANNDDPQLFAGDLAESIGIRASAFYGEPEGQMVSAYLRITNPIEHWYDAKGNITRTSRPEGEHDGIIHHNTMDTNDPRNAWIRSTVYQVLTATQIKSAISNTGEFSDTNPDIRFSNRRTPTYTEPQAFVDAALPGLMQQNITIDGKPVGFVSLKSENGQPKILAHIEIFDSERGQGYAEDVMADLLGKTDELWIYNIQPDSVPFWKKMGVTLDEYEDWNHGNGTLDEGTYRANAEERGQARQEAGDERQAGADAGRGLAEEGNDLDFTRFSTPRFVSALAQQVEQMPAKVANTSAQNVKLWLLSNQKIKKDEIQWSGITDWLDTLGKQKVSKEQVADYLRAGGVKIEEVVLGDDDVFSDVAIAPSIGVLEDADIAPSLPQFHGETSRKVRFKRDGMLWTSEAMSNILENNRGHEFRWITKQVISAARRVEEYAEEKAGGTKFAGYRLPGGTDYRELLLTLPSDVNAKEQSLRSWHEQMKSKYKTIGWKELATPEEVAENDKRVAALQKDQKAFHSSHWDQPNVLAHMRVDTVEGADGKKYLRVIEIQSDWGQKGKKEGFDLGRSREYSVKEIDGQFFVVNKSDEKTAAAPRATASDAQQVADRMNRGSDASGGGNIPTAPFVTDTKSWTALVIKRALMMAVTESHDGIVFATGQQNADLYDLSKSISRVKYEDNGSGGIGMARMDGDPSGGMLYAYDLDNKEVISKRVEPSEVPDLIGKDAAEKLFASKPESGTSPGGTGIRRRQIRGLDLKVGGEGMREFYDRIVPSVTKDVLKKLGAGDTVVGKVDVLTAKKDAWGDIDPDYDGDPVQQPGFLIPAQLADKVREGVPMFSTNRLIGNSGRQYTPEQEAMHQRVGRVAEDKTILERLKDYIQKRWRQGIFDQFAPFYGTKAYTLMRLSKGSTGAFEAFMKHGKLSLRDGAYDADTTGGVIENVFHPLGKETTDFLYWIAGNRAERLITEGKERLFTNADIQAAKSLADGQLDFDYILRNGTVTRSRKAAYMDSLVKFNEFNKNVMDMAEQSGLIDGAARHLWEHEFYVPFYRVMEDENTRAMGIKKGIVRQEAFKKLKGGDEQLGDLLMNTLLNWHHLVDAASKNRAAKAAIETAEQMGVARPAVTGETKTVWFMDNGQKVDYKVDDPAVMEAVNGLQYAGLQGPLWSILTAPKHWLTVGVTASPFFKVRNLIRDSVQAIATSDLGYNIASNVVEGIKLTARDRQEYVSALAGGGLIRFGTMLEGNEAKRTRQLIRKGAKDAAMLDSQGAWTKFYTAALEPAIEAYNELGNRGEEINRMSLYNQLIKQGQDHATASLMARDLMDFSLQGSFETIRILSQIVPFFNARMQGMYKLGRATKENRAHMATVIFTAAMASLALMGMAAGDEDKWKKWKKREEWDKASNWWFEFGGVQYRIPKPFELGTVSHVVERTVEGMFDKERDAGQRTAKALMDAAMNQLSMNPTPQAFKPIIDLYANYDSFTKRPIETMSMQRLDKSQRYTAQTSMPARALGEMGGLSPVQYDHLVRSYFGWLGALSVGTADIVARSVNNEPTKPALDYWKFATGGILQEDQIASRYTSMMYDQAAELEQAHATYNKLRKDGKLDEAKEYREDNKDKLNAYRSVENVKKQVATISEKIRMIERSNIHPAEKRIQIRALKERQSQIASKLSQ